MVDVDSDEGKPISVRIAKIDADNPILALTLKPTLSGYRLDQYEKDLIEQDQLRELALSEADFMMMLNPVRHAWHVWSQF